MTEEQQAQPNEEKLEKLEDLEPDEAADVRGGRTTFPDVVKRPPPSGPTPIPYPNT